MALVTATEVKTAAKNSKVGVLLQSNDDIDDMIAICQADLERRTGGIFESREVVEKRIGHRGRLIQLGHYPITSIDELLIDGSAYTLDDEELEEQTGSIILSSPPLTPTYYYQATYTTAIPNDAALAKHTLCLMVLDMIKNRESTVEPLIKRLNRTYIGAI
jgi:hypothetical protein